MDEPIKILVLGASGMLGSAMLRFFSESPGYVTMGSVRSPSASRLLPKSLQDRVISGVEIENTDGVAHLFARVRPNVVINCVGVVKQLAEANEPLVVIPINSLLPHRLARLCDLSGSRFIHISTDCVFSGSKGMYSEADASDAHDLYGRSKFLGEVDYPNAITLRTSIIGHELNSAHGLIDWFLSQQAKVAGYSKAIFSGLPTVELARIVRDFVVPRPDIRGLYHVSASPINKHDLLTLVARVYGKSIEIVADDKVIIDRSLDSTRFRHLTGYDPPSWVELVQAMRDFA